MRQRNSLTEPCTSQNDGCRNTSIFFHLVIQQCSSCFPSHSGMNGAAEPTSCQGPRQGQGHGGWQCTCTVLHASAAPRLLQAGLPLPAVPQLWLVSESLGIDHNQGPAILCVNDPGPLGSLLALQGTLSPRFSHHCSSPVVLSLYCASESPTAF